MNVEHEEVREVIDYIAITRLKHRWATHYDSGALHELMKVFTEDAVMDQGPYGLWEGQEEIRAGYEGRMALRKVKKARMHVVTNPSIRIEGDVAHGEWYVLDVALRPDGQRPLGLVATCDDVYRRGPDGWRIARSKVDILWSELGE